jgi:hypothetical protein
MKIDKKQKNKIYILIVILVVFIGVFIFLKKPASQTITNNSIVSTDANRKFYSKQFKLELNVPNQFKIVTNDVSISMVKNAQTITLIRNGTNFPALSEYIKDFDSKRDIRIVQSMNNPIAGLDSLSRIIKTSDRVITQKSYYIFIENTVYIISTSSPELYEDLDKIAKSFHYIP